MRSASAISVPWGDATTTVRVSRIPPLLIGRIAVSTLVSLFLVILALRWPVHAMTIGVVSSLAVLLLGGGLLAAGGRLHQRASRQTHQSGVKTGVLARDHGLAFLMWFFGHNLVWTGGLTLWTCAVLRVFGPRGGVLVVGAGCLAAALFSLSGLVGRSLVGRGSLSMLGLCWQHHVPLPGTSLLVYPEIAVALWPRFENALDLDVSSARKRGQMSAFTRIQIALDLTRTDRSAPRFDLGKTPREAMLHETAVRARALPLVAWPAMLLTLLLALGGVLKTPASFDPESWTMGGSRTPTPETQKQEEEREKDQEDKQEKAQEEEQEEAQEEAQSEQGKAQDETSESSGEKDQEFAEGNSSEGDESEDGNGGTSGASSNQAGSQDASQGGQQGEGQQEANPGGQPDQSGEGQSGQQGKQGERGKGGQQGEGQRDGQQGEGQEGQQSQQGQQGGQQSQRGKGQQGQQGKSGQQGQQQGQQGQQAQQGQQGQQGQQDKGKGGQQNQQSKGKDGQPGKGQQQGQQGQQQGQQGQQQGQQGKGGQQGQQSQQGGQQGQQGQSGAGQGSQPGGQGGKKGQGQGGKPSSSPSADSEGSGPGGGGGWGLGSASPEGAGSTLKLPTGGQILTLEMAQIGGQTIRLEQNDPSPPSSSEASRGAATGPRQPSQSPPPREKTEPKSAQQPLPAWIVRLLGGKPKDDS